jgi:serine/threonine-protein kinase RsbW
MEVHPGGRELVWHRSFPGRAEHVRHVREFVGFLLVDLPDVEDVVLVASEFAANALRHTASAEPGGRFCVEVRRWRDGAAVSLTDEGGPKVPVVPDHDDLSECGRGLHTVTALATEWYWTGDSRGRTFTASFLTHTGAVMVSAVPPLAAIALGRRETPVFAPDTA